MGAKPDYIKKHFSSLQAKTLRNALAQRMGEHFPRLGGPRILALCADLVLEVVEQHLRPREHLRPGQALWLAVATGSRPRQYQRIAQTPLVPVVLDLSTHEDVAARLERVRPDARLLQKALRLCEQSHAQGGLLSNCDLAELLNTQDSRVAQLLAQHERETGRLVPRRATLHDVGTGLTHKRIICLKRYREGKDPHVIARETRHSLEAVDNYLGTFERIRACRVYGFSEEQTAYFLHCSLRLVKEHLAILDELEHAHETKS